MVSVENWLGADNVLGIDIWKKKYQWNGETFEAWLDRVSGGDKAVRKLILQKKFIFGGRILANRRTNVEKKTYSNCYVLSIDSDSIEAIYKTAGDMALTYKAGGGVGVDISALAPKGAKVNNAAKTTSGAVSFIDLFSTTTGLIGQCIEENQNVLTPSGLKKIKDVAVGDSIWTAKGYKTVIRTMNQGVQEIYKVKTKFGYEILATSNHEFVTTDGAGLVDKQIGDMKCGENLVILGGIQRDAPPIKLKQIEFEKPQYTVYDQTGNCDIKRVHYRYEKCILPMEITKEFAYLLGYIAGNGCCYRGINTSISCNSKDKDIIDRICQYRRKVFGYAPCVILKQKENTARISIGGMEITAFLKENGLEKSKAHDVDIPDCIFKASSEVQGAYLSGLFDADGHFSKKSSISLTTISENLSHSVQKMLMMNGIISKIHTEVPKEKNWNLKYRISISGKVCTDMVKSFMSESVKQKRKSLSWNYENYMSPYTARDFHIVHKEFNFVPDDGFMSIRCVKRLGGLGDSGTLALDKICEVKKVGVANTYDITLEEENRFWCEGFYVHNSGRRGALMVSIACDHPDIEDFIKLKTDVDKATTANLSIRVTDDFMKAVQNDEDWYTAFTRKETGECISKKFKARELFKEFCDANYDYGEPGLLFWSNIEKYNMLSSYPDFKFSGTNPCFTGDMKLTIMENGIIKRVPMEELAGRDDITVVSCNGMVSYGNRVWCNGEKETVSVRTKNGAIKCTPDHVFMLAAGAECKAKDLKGKTLIHFGEDISFDTVLSVEKGEMEKVYDFTEKNNHWGIVEDYVVHNCGELPLPAGGACLLGSINLSEYVRSDGTFDMASFGNDVKVAIRALDDVQREGAELHPLKIQKDMVSKWRQLGLGIMGLGDMLIKMNIRYGTPEALKQCNDIATVMAKSAIEESESIGEEKGAFPSFSPEKTAQSEFWIKHFADEAPKNMANSQLLAIAPTGSISTMLGVSGGIEPLFALEYDRTTKSLDGKDMTYKVIPKVVQFAREKGYLNGLVSASDISYTDRINMQAEWQSHIDGSISSTINLPQGFPREDVERLYLYAWQKGLKGVTVFRDGCKREGVLKKDIQLNEHEIVGLSRTIQTGCGRLHVVGMFDRETGNITECYLNRGSDGGCNSFMVGLSRLVSLSSRKGASIDEVVDQLVSCPVCPSYAVRRATKGDTAQGTCCPSAVGKVFLEMSNEVRNMKVSKNPEEHHYVKNPCPQCGAEMQSSNGCWSCASCGYSKCS